MRPSTGLSASDRAASAAGTTTAPEWSQPPVSSSSKAWQAVPLASAAARGESASGVPQTGAGPAGSLAASAKRTARPSAEHAPASPQASVSRMCRRAFATIAGGSAANGVPVVKAATASAISTRSSQAATALT